MFGHFEFLKNLTLRGGPDLSDYPALNICYSEIAGLARNGRISPVSLQDAWGRLGDAFYSTKTLQGFVNIKPHGYPGDFEIIDRIYLEWVSPDQQFAKWDRFFRAQQACKAVRNRKSYFLRYVDQLLQHYPGNEMIILNVGSGPGRDILECLRRHGNRLLIECVDSDSQAIEHLLLLNSAHLDRIHSHCCNALRFRSSYPFHLVWSAGLFDYLTDTTFKCLLRRLYHLVRSGGELVIGNFSPDNESRDYMECGGWFLNYRTDEQLLSLAHACGIPACSTSVTSEPEGINLFLHIRKV